MLQRAAIVDLGTNTFHMLIIQWEDNLYKVLDKLQIPVKLGKGAFKDSIIQPDAYSRGVSALIEFKSLMASYDITRVEAFGTSALRNATNTEEFLHEAEILLGTPVKVIDGGQEAEYIYNGVKRAVPLGDEPHLIMDIGGGSVEFIIADGKTIFWKKSYEIGAARLIERFADGDPMSEKAIASLEDYLEKQLEMVWLKAEKYQIKTLVGASGSFETLAAIEMELFHSAKQATHFMHYILQLPLFEKIYNKMLISSQEELAQLPGMPAFRVEMITVAVVMVHYVLHRMRLKKMIVSDYALKEGVMFKLMSEEELDWKVTE
jgi:exopolyphosphatase/guanosine-5'-triphosphate,3'-diphosphate pyrophosphatase